MKLTTGRRDGFFVFQFTTHTRTVTVTVTVTDSSPKSLVSTGAACQNPSAVSESKTGDGKGSPLYRLNMWYMRWGDDDHPFIVLTETKFSFRCIPVWIGTLLTGLGSKKTHVIMFSP